MKIDQINSKHKNILSGSLNLFRWLVPGLGVKRWFLILLVGTTLIGIGLAIIVLDVYRTSPNTWWLPILSAASLRFLARPLRALVFGVIGIGLILLGIWGINRAIMKPYRLEGKKMVDSLTVYRRKERGPKIVTMGGGHGLSTVLRGLKEYSNNITAVVSVADDGGSSGRIRREIGILPPGDIRDCLAALSSDEALLSQLFQYRFPYGEDGLNGHSFGNLFITALVDITGSFEEAVAESGRVLAVHGRVLPATIQDVRLLADVRLPHLAGEVRIEGESEIPGYTGRVKRVWLEPNSPPAFPEAIRAILGADLVVIGPGSLYTSIIPNLLVPDIAAAVRASRALKIYVCNLATQLGETENFNCEDHIRAIEEHVGENLVDVIVANNEWGGKLPGDSQWVRTDDGVGEHYSVYEADLIDNQNPWRHDSRKLSQILLDLLREKTGPLVE